MADRQFTTEQVLALLNHEEDVDEYDDVFMADSDEEFDNLEEASDGDSEGESKEPSALGPSFPGEFEDLEEVNDEELEGEPALLVASSRIQTELVTTKYPSPPLPLPPASYSANPTKTYPSPLLPFSPTSYPTNQITTCPSPLLPLPPASYSANPTTTYPSPLLLSFPPTSYPTNPITTCPSPPLPLTPTSCPANQTTPSYPLPLPPTSCTANPEEPWTRKLVEPVIHPFIQPLTLGPTVPIPDTPLDIFRLFFDQQTINEIAMQSNQYALEVMGADKFINWTPMTSAEVEALFGFNFLMGLCPKPSIMDYWRKDPVYNYPSIVDKISRNRYREINRYLHFVDNSTLVPRGTPGYDKIGKIRPLICHLQSRFKSVYNSGRDIAVDEAMIKFQGRSTLKQYMPKKPIKRGIKVWVLGDSSNGYFSQLEVYTGKKENTTEKGLGARVVKELTKGYQGRWHQCYFDNFFTSKRLLSDLLEVGIYGCGTARSDRKLFPKELQKPKLDKRGDTLTVQSGAISASVWKDNRPVTVMYTGFSPLDHSTVQRREKTGRKVTVPCPLAVAAYNMHMGGVDRGDQLRGFYHHKLNSRKYYRYISNFFIEVALTNAFILFKETNPTSKTTIKSFQQILATQLIGDYCSRRRAGRISHPVRPLQLQHFPMKSSSADGGRKRGRCTLCREKERRRSDTSWFCQECDVWLCHSGGQDDCFYIHHRSRQSCHP